MIESLRALLLSLAECGQWFLLKTTRDERALNEESSKLIRSLRAAKVVFEVFRIASEPEFGKLFKQSEERSYVLLADKALDASAIMKTMSTKAQELLDMFSRIWTEDLELIQKKVDDAIIPWVEKRGSLLSPECKDLVKQMCLAPGYRGPPPLAAICNLLQVMGIMLGRLLMIALESNHGC